MLICLSGRYIEDELAVHYGRIPPSFMPVNGNRLFSLQGQAYVAGERAVLTLPKDFPVTTDELQSIQHAGFEVFNIDPRLSLTEAISEVLRYVNTIPKGESVRLLFGDTLVDIENIPSATKDFVVVNSAQIEYPWTYGEQTKETTLFFEQDPSNLQDHPVVCGYFSFFDFALLKKAATEKTLHMALNTYSASRQLQLIEAQHWYDFGHLTLFYKSKCDLLLSRSFNLIDANNHTITKTSKQTAKMYAEASWFENLPPKFLMNTPRFIGRKNKDKRAGYELEYLHLPTLSDMLVFGRLNTNSIALILSRCVQLLAEFRSLRPEPNAPESSKDYATSFYQEVIQHKTWSRFESFCADFGCNLNSRLTLNGETLPPLDEIITAALSKIPMTRPEDISFWHGDFFFGNLFFDFNSQRIMMVDPRGMLFNNVFTQYGDYRYDIGKLSHSVLGGYDHIINNQAKCRRPSPHEFEFLLPGFERAEHNFSIELLCSLVEAEFGINSEELNALAIIMFFSLLPLHQDSPKRQASLFANGLRLSRNLKV